MSNNDEKKSSTSQDLELPEVNNYSLPEIHPHTHRQPSLVWLFVDFLCLAAVGFTCLGFKLAATPYKRGFYCDDDSINKPYKESTVPSSVLYSVGFAVAYLVILVTECFHQRQEKSSKKTRLEKDHYKFGPLLLNPLHVELLRLFISFAFGGLITIFATDVGKYTAGRLRPHFLSICKPPSSVFINCSHNYILDDVCTGDPAYAMTFTALYMEARIHFPHSKFLKFFLQLVVAQLGILCSLSRVSDYKHHWTDVLAGLLLGILIAVLIFDRVVQMVRKDTKSRQPVTEDRKENGHLLVLSLSFGFMGTIILSPHYASKPKSE
ncbi:unnamed protein product [Porites evermanni]|uniref:Phosphatidic acid phosphatase type 2/haloperoxidase domain-containing protein n=1 Tax=Porites evermanni TaxID=104178 RepID=A0ABN8SZF4_9CNID|nr:unnamed protein product [Porites evermanni]